MGWLVVAVYLAAGVTVEYYVALAERSHSIEQPPDLVRLAGVLLWLPVEVFVLVRGLWRRVRRAR